MNTHSALFAHLMVGDVVHGCELVAIDTTNNLQLTFRQGTRLFTVEPKIGTGWLMLCREIRDLAETAAIHRMAA